MHLGVQCLDAAVHHLGKSRHVGDADDGQSRGFERLRGAARGDELETALGKTARERHEAGFIGNAQERSGHEGSVHILAQVK